MLQLLDGKIVCKRCGVQLDVPDGHTQEVTFLAASRKPVLRLVKVDGEEIHRCPVIVRRLTRRERVWDDWAE